jgi:hypothetical protein
MNLRRSASNKSKSRGVIDGPEISPGTSMNISGLVSEMQTMIDIVWPDPNASKKTAYPPSRNKFCLWASNWKGRLEEYARESVIANERSNEE